MAGAFYIAIFNVCNSVIVADIAISANGEKGIMSSKYNNRMAWQWAETWNSSEWKLGEL